MRDKLMAFRWYGGKYSHLDFLLPHLPRAFHYCEPYGGSAAVLLNRAPSPIETYNDLGGAVVNFFRTLRDQPDELVAALELTPYSHEEFSEALEETAGLSDVEWARRFFIAANQCWSGRAQVACPGNWSVATRVSRRGMSMSVSSWLGKIERLPQVVERLQRVQIECRPAIEVIRHYDTPRTLFYCDPPYPHSARTTRADYRFELSRAEHRELAEVLHDIEGQAAISGYHCTLLDNLYADWRCVEGPAKPLTPTQGSRQEVLWMNYGAGETLQPTLSL